MHWTLVTGGAKRLGAELCLSLAQQGHSILVHYRTSKDEAMQVADACRRAGVQAEIIQGDFSTPDSTMSFIRDRQRRFPEIKNLINNVGNYLLRQASDTTLDEWASLFQTNVHAPFALAQAFLPSIRECRGNIINIGVVGLNSARADVYRPAYMASKMALWMLTKSLAREQAPFCVRVNMVSPGYLENAIDIPKEIDRLPMKRLGELKEVARVVAFLLQDESSYITGQNIEVGGAVNL